MGAWDVTSYGNDGVADIVHDNKRLKKYLSRKTFNEPAHRISIGPGVVLYCLKKKISDINRSNIVNSIKQLEKEKQSLESGLDGQGWKNKKKRLEMIKKEIKYLKSSSTKRSKRRSIRRSRRSRKRSFGKATKPPGTCLYCTKNPPCQYAHIRVPNKPHHFYTVGLCKEHALQQEELYSDEYIISECNQ